MRVLAISLLWLLLRETVIMLLETYPLLGKLQLEIVVGTITGPYYVHKNVIKSKTGANNLPPKPLTRGPAAIFLSQKNQVFTLKRTTFCLFPITEINCCYYEPLLQT